MRRVSLRYYCCISAAFFCIAICQCALQRADTALPSVGSASKTTKTSVRWNPPDLPVQQTALTVTATCVCSACIAVPSAHTCWNFSLFFTFFILKTPAKVLILTGIFKIGLLFEIAFQIVLIHMCWNVLWPQLHFNLIKVLKNTLR